MLLLQLVIVLGTVAIAGVVAVEMRQQQIRDAHEARMIGVAQSVAQLPQVRDAFTNPQPAVAIQPHWSPTGNEIVYNVVHEATSPSSRTAGSDTSPLASIVALGLLYKLQS
jgi:sensor histidine kinase regulating citrate/malate metabolism